MYKTKHIGLPLRSPAAALLCAVMLLLSVIAQYAVNCSQVRSGVLRLHVIANSDSDADQSVKLRVRDAVLESGQSIFDGSVTSEQAVEKITPALGSIESTAQAVLSENAMQYGAKAYIAEEYFDTRAYGNITLPAGKYTALKIVLGEGEGKNWWCVMFPPLCLPAATFEDDAAYAVFSDSGSKVVNSESKYEIRFGIVELFEKLISLFKS